jgi:hypothetical protein
MNRFKNWRTTLTQRGFSAVAIHCSYRKAAVLMVAFALILAVTTRYTDYVDAGAPATGSAVHQKLENKRQHIEKTSFVWLVALTNLVRLKPPVTPRVAPVLAPLTKVFYGEDLYNRPPPFLL